MKPETKSDVCEKCGSDRFDYYHTSMYGYKVYMHRMCLECKNTLSAKVDLDDRQIAKQIFNDNFNAAKEASK